MGLPNMLLRACVCVCVHTCELLECRYENNWALVDVCRHFSALCVCGTLWSSVRLFFCVYCTFVNQTIDEEGLSVPIFPWLLWSANQNFHMRDAANHEVNTNQTVEPSDQTGLKNIIVIILELSSEERRGGGGRGGAVLPEEEMFVKNLSGQTRHCGILPSHERSLNPDKDTRVRGERGD